MFELCPAQHAISSAQATTAGACVAHLAAVFPCICHCSCESFFTYIQDTKALTMQLQATCPSILPLINHLACKQDAVFNFVQTMANLLVEYLGGRPSCVMQCIAIQREQCKLACHSLSDR